MFRFLLLCLFTDMKKVINIILLMVSINQLFAQALVNDGAILSVSNSAILSITGDAVNKGSILNKGKIYFSGNWNNQNTYQADTGTIVLNGSAIQNIFSKNQPVYRLEVNGSGEKFLNDTLTIIKGISLINGILTPNKTECIIKRNAIVTGGVSGSYINGKLTIEGEDSLYFPVGKNGDFRPFWLVNIKGSNIVTSIETFTPNVFLNKGILLDSVLNSRYWERTLKSGTFDSAYTILSFGTADFLDSIGNIVVAGASDTDQKYHSLGKLWSSGNVNFGFVHSKRMGNFSYYALGISSSPKGKDIYLPNAFSPFAANAEDRVFRIYGPISPDNFNIKIFNKWGNMVFQSQSLSEMKTIGWDGKDIKSGKYEQGGLYTYVLKAIHLNGTVIQKSGSISIIK